MNSEKKQTTPGKRQQAPAAPKPSTRPSEPERYIHGAPVSVPSQPRPPKK